MHSLILVDDRLSVKRVGMVQGHSMAVETIYTRFLAVSQTLGNHRHGFNYHARVAVINDSAAEARVEQVLAKLDHQHLPMNSADLARSILAHLVKAGVNVTEVGLERGDGALVTTTRDGKSR
jgi:hypothetical protein